MRSAWKHRRPTGATLHWRSALTNQRVRNAQDAERIVRFSFAGLGTCKLHAVVTNRPLDAAELIAWYRKRCGKSEEAHAVMKNDLGGGILPSGDFGNNAAWWAIMLLTFNLNTLMKRLALGEAWSCSRIKALRRNLICVAARVVEHARQVVVRLSDAHPSTRLIQDVRQRIVALAPGPAG